MEFIAKTIEVLSEHIIPIWVALISLLSNVFSKMFIREKLVHMEFSHHVNYLLTGQGLLICPLVVLISIVRSTMIGQTITYASVFALAIYLAIYLFAIVHYLNMSADEFQNSSGLLIRWFYKAVPLVLILTLVIIKILST